MSIKVTTNIPEFKRELAALGQRMEKNIVRSGARAAGRVFRDEARRRAPVLQRDDFIRTNRVPGALKRAIVTISRRSPRGTVRQSVTVRASKAQRGRGADPFYWRFLEGGWIPRGPGQRFRGGTRRRRLERQRAVAGGARRIAYPFLKPAFDAVGQPALAAFTKAVEDGIARANLKT
jgi:HK97 gp10 family phage protein